MPAPPARYRSPEEDSARWDDFPFRPGDVVISTRSKHGTTWMQMICALLIHRGPTLPQPLAELSPWVDWLVVSEDELFARLEAQPHRRVVKTHTPLDGVPIRPDVTYIVVARHPLDAAVSLYHQGANLDRDRIADLTGEPRRARAEAPPLAEWLRGWIEHQADPHHELDSLPGVLHHLADAWQRRGEPNVLLVHYDDLLADLPRAMARIADALEIAIDPAELERLAAAASFGAMRARADELAPDPVGVLRDRQRFFRAGRSGSAQAVLDDEDLARYEARAAALAPADLLRWLHRPRV